MKQQLSSDNNDVSRIGLSSKRDISAVFGLASKDLLNFLNNIVTSNHKKFNLPKIAMLTLVQSQREKRSDHFGAVVATKQ